MSSGEWGQARIFAFRISQSPVWAGAHRINPFESPYAFSQCRPAMISEILISILLESRIFYSFKGSTMSNDY